MHKLLPQEVISVLTELERSGYESYLVGGAVRDLLLGSQPFDYDIATSARPEEILSIAGQNGWKVVDGLGQNYGVVTLVVGTRTLEVAAFRAECYGNDSHRPSGVWFTQSLENDLKRRDFTINAMAMNIQGKVVDLFGGRHDLFRQVIRCVGEAQTRFYEDALRMFRACRFASQLGFTIEDSTFRAFLAALPKVEGLSLERVKAEVEKLLLGKYPELGLQALVSSKLNETSCVLKVEGIPKRIPVLPEISHLVGLIQNPTFHRYDAWRHTIYTVKAVPCDLPLRWGALLHDIGKGMPGVRAFKDGEPTDHGHDKVGAAMAEAILARWQYNAKIVKHVTWLVMRHMKFHYYYHMYQDTTIRWVRSEARSGRFRNATELVKALEDLCQICSADMISCGADSQTVSNAEAYGRKLCMLAQGMPVHTSDLAVSGKEIIDLIKEKHLVGKIMKYLLKRVQDGSLLNQQDVLLNSVSKNFSSDWAVKEEPGR